MRELRAPSSHFAIALVIAAATYTAFLCFTHTRVAGISNLHVAILDGAITIAALVLALRGRSRWLWILLTALAANTLLIALLAEQLDPKSVRDPLALIAFTALGWRYGTFERLRLVFLAVSALVIGFALFEFLAPALYTQFFDVIDFYAARGVVDAQTIQRLDSSFFISGLRNDERMLLPFLGPHRVSSIFLEPVSMGNFGALALAFALSLGARRWRMAAAAGAVAVLVIILADARFASMAAVCFLIARFFPLKWSRLALAVLPLCALGLLIGFGLSDIGRGDDFATRLAGSGRILLSMSPDALFGLGSYEIVTYDAGYAYALSSLGLPLCIALWAAFVLFPTASREGACYKLLLGVYICALLCISGSSLFALKTAGLGFFALGALAAGRRSLAIAPERARPPLPHGAPA